MTEDVESSETDKINTEQHCLVWMDIEMSGLDPEVNTIKKEKAHTALKDIYESISELKYYRSKIFVE